MPEQSKFTAALGNLNQKPAEPPAEERPPLLTPAVTEEAKGKGRPPGKRSDPDYQPTTVLLRKQTKKTASRLLEDRDTGQDLSDLIEQLLTEWVGRKA